MRDRSQARSRIGVWLAAVALLVASGTTGFLSCGNTSDHAPDFGDTLASRSCAPDSSCLELRAPIVQIVDTVNRFSADLTDGSGNPVSGVEVCFSVEDNAADIVEPVDGCGLTDSTGHISGSMRPTIPGSFHLIATPSSGFGLINRLLLRFDTESDQGGDIGDSCSNDDQCQPDLFCDVGPCLEANPFNANTCQPRGGEGAACSCSTGCISRSCNDDPEGEDLGQCSAP